MNIDTQYMEDTEMMSTIPAGYELPAPKAVDGGMGLIAMLAMYVVALVGIVGFAALVAAV